MIQLKEHIDHSGIIKIFVSIKIYQTRNCKTVLCNYKHSCKTPLGIIRKIYRQRDRLKGIEIDR